MVLPKIVKCESPKVEQQMVQNPEPRLIKSEMDLAYMYKLVIFINILLVLLCNLSFFPSG